jgi:hypothetical protein
MRRSGLTVFALLIVVGLATVCMADEPKGEADSRGKLAGTWKLVSARYGGQEYKFPEEITTIKHITPTQFMWASYDRDGRVTRAAGGRYTLQGEDYEETPEYGLSNDFEVIKGKTHSFKCKVHEGRWFLDGKLSNGTTIEEVWERLEKK